MINLKTVLLGNAIFSSTSGFAMIIFNRWLAEVMGIQMHWVLLAIGFGLIFFAFTIFYQATRPETARFQTNLIIVQDLLWVLGSAIVVIFQLFGLTTTGYVMITLVAIAVADFALLQWLGLKRVSKLSRTEM